MSFSGLKTALLRARDAVVADQGGLTVQDRADLCAGFQAAVRDVLAEKTRRALNGQCPICASLAVAGGVAANQAIRGALMQVAEEAGARFLAPPLALCTDNAAMIAYAGAELFRAGRRDDMTLAARPRWPLDAAAPRCWDREERAPRHKLRCARRAIGCAQSTKEPDMLIALIARDKPGALQIRLDKRDAHVAYLKNSGVVSQAGPLLDDGGQMCGSLVVLEVADMAAAQAWAANDPYAKAGLFASVEMIQWKKVI